MEKSIISGDTENSSISSISGVRSNGRSNVAIDFEDIMKCEILSRLPVKSLMRFKCVSKTWLSLIEEDPYFADLHFERTKAHPALLLVVTLRSKNPSNLYRISHELFLEASLSRDSSKAEIHSIRKTKAFSCNEILGPVNGLICFLNRVKKDVGVYNISTREASPRVRSTLINQESLSGSRNTIFEFGYGFGFDPVAKKHKVLCVCCIIPKTGDQYKVCEVLTVGEDAWRRIDEVPPCDFANSFVYVNGSIYYCTSKFRNGNWGNNDVVLVAFDVGSEKFRTITMPDLILNNRSSNRYRRPPNLLEVNGHIAISWGMSDFIVKLWVYREDTEYDEKGKNTKTTNFGNLEENWTEDAITLPFSWDHNLSWGFYTGSGMHQILIQSDQRLHSGINSATLYSYDLKKKTFTEIEVSGIPSSIPNECHIKLASSFSESLFPIQKQRSSIEASRLNVQQECDSHTIV